MPQGHPFTEWLDEIENFSSRWERCVIESDSRDAERLYIWLFEAYKLGLKSGMGALAKKIEEQKNA